VDGGLTRHRRCFALRGSVDETRSAARSIVAALSDVLWIGDDGIPPSRVRGLLGRSFDAVVLDQHGGLDADVLGQAQGFVWGGGCLVLRLPPEGELPRDARLAVFPYQLDDVGTRFAERFERMLPRVLPTPQPKVVRQVTGTDEQARVVDALVETFAGGDPAMIALLADRGRGKSSALGMAIARAPSLRVAITAESEAATDEIFRFAEGRARFVPASELLHGDASYDVIVVDEAAQLSVAVLERLATKHVRARIAFATTARGYEGTGRGFVLRFLAWARRQPRPFSCHELHAPIRWGEGDPLERFVLDVLALDAEPAEPPSSGQLRCVELDRDALARDEPRLREVFGLLVHAHYRTTPSDLQRLLDAPNLAVHAALLDDHVVGATLVAREGGLPRDLCERLASGRERVHGHALPDTLITHAGRPEAGELSMVRSIRIAVHPSSRRHGVARALVEHVHASYSPDLFGTIFGATPDLLSFRRSVGYELVRLGMSRGRRSGEPAAIMVRPVSSAAAKLVEELRVDLARNLPLQCELLDRELVLDPELSSALTAGLPAAAPPTEDELQAMVVRYAYGPQPFDAAAYALARWVEAHRDALGALDPRARAVVEGRVVQRRPWVEVAAGDSVPRAMRALRPAIVAMVEQVHGRKGRHGGPAG